MGNSTTSVQSVLDRVAAKGIPSPLNSPAGYAVDVALQMANDTMSDIIAERFNWKWNRANAAPFYTNSFQQDYPQIGLSAIGWLEDCDRVDINNTAMPKPLRNITVRKQLSRTSLMTAPVTEICWMYNNQLSYGTWPGANVRYYPLVAAQTNQNPIMSMIDANGNLLIVTTFGITGSVAPVLASNSAEGATVTDGTVVWTVVAPNGQGFRVNPLPGASGPVWQLTVYYQRKPIALTSLSSLIEPIPDDWGNVFQRGMECYCLQASPNPGDAKRGELARVEWLTSLVGTAKQGDREQNSYAMLPATSPVDNVWTGLRNPQDPGQPY